MIVSIAAWLYIISALLTLGSLFAGPFRVGGMAGFATFAMAALFGAIGYGLLNRESWGRWLALGHSLITWTIGSLALLAVVGAALVGGTAGMYFSMLFSSGLGAVLGVIVLVAFALVLVSLVINLKLFFYLCSEAGCEQFGVPHGSARTVIASVGAWIAIFIGQGVMSAGGASSLLMNSVMKTASDAEPMAPDSHVADEARRRDEDAAHRRAVLESNQRQLEAAREADRPAAPAAAPEPEPEPPAADAAPVEQPAAPAAEEEAAAPALYTNNGDKADDSERSATKILKCRDASGAVTFTQGYCPAGTKRVEMTPGQ